MDFSDLLCFFVPGSRAVKKCVKSSLFSRVVRDRAKSSILSIALNKFGIIKEREPRFGDVVFCVRHCGVYRHFGVYVGNGRVIHFAPSDGGDMGGDAYVHEVSLDEFADGDIVSVFEFSEHYESNSLLRKIAMSSDYKLQSPEDTVRRARSLLGQKGLNNSGYHLIMNNCEDFAIWCKTNVYESKQVNDFIDLIIP